MGRWSRRRRAEDELARTRAAYDTALAESGVVLFNQVAPGLDGHHVSPSMGSVLGWEPSAFSSAGTLRALVHPDDLPLLATVLPPSGMPSPFADGEATIDLTDGGAPAPTAPAAVPDPVVRFRGADGTWHAMQVRVTATAAHGGARGSLVDVTVEDRARSTERRMFELVDRSPAACMVLEFTVPDDPDTLVVRAGNRAARRMLNLERRAVDGTPISELFGHATSQLIRSALFDVFHTGQTLTAERLTLAEIPSTHLDLRVDRLGDGTLGVTITDVTRTVAIEDRLRHQASHDALTGLPNRALFEERTSAVVGAPDAHGTVALVLVDIDQLREVNESLGLLVGDQLIVEIGRRITRDVQGLAVVSRVGGDEFGVLTMPAATVDEALERAESVRLALARPFDVSGHLVECRATVGVALTTLPGEAHQTLLKHADSALHSAKRAGVPMTVFDRSEEPGSIRRVAVLAELQQAVARKELELRFQPMVDLRTARVTKVQAQVNWRRGTDGTRVPLELIELASNSGLIQPLTKWVLGEAGAAAAELSTLEQRVVVSTRMALRSLADPELADFVDTLLRSGELLPGHVEIEVAETELNDDPGAAHETLERFAASGLQFTVADFGAGYAALATLAHLPVVGLKIDRTFIATLASAPADAAIVRNIVDVSHELGLSVTAEGVADAAALARLVEFGCDTAQGFHLSEAVSAVDLPARIAELETAVRGWIGTSPTVDLSDTSDVAATAETWSPGRR